MEFFKQKTSIDFIGLRYALLTVSGLIVAASLLCLATKGLNYGIEFTGGSLVQITYERPQTLDALRPVVANLGYGDVGLQQFTGTSTFQVRLKTEGEGSAQLMDEFLSKLQEAFPGNKFRVDTKDYVGPMVGKHLYRQALLAIVLSLLGIVVYVAFRFSNFVWGVTGILALGHDVIALLGLYSIMGCEFNLILVAAVLTLAGYSINDTIVIFDRMREKMRLFRKEPLGNVINQSMNETLSRTVITALTVLFSVAILALFGGQVVRDFAIGMTFGTLVGCFSTLAIAAPLVYEWEVRWSGGHRAAEGSLASPTALPAAPSQPEKPADQSARPPRHERRRRRG